MGIYTLIERALVRDLLFQCLRVRNKFSVQDGLNTLFRESDPFEGGGVLSGRVPLWLL